jgi:hypothetical protein
MSHIEVILYLELPVAIKLKQNLTRDENGDWIRNDLTNAQRRKLSNAFQDKLNRVTLGADTYVGISLYIPKITVADDDPRLHWLEKLKELLPGKEFVLGAWETIDRNYWTSDGKVVMYGQEILRATYDEDGNEVTPELVTGTPIYPLHAQYLKAMPDDVTYDEDGNETSRTPATEFKQVHKISGHPDRYV